MLLYRFSLFTPSPGPGFQAFRQLGNILTACSRPCQTGDVRSTVQGMCIICMYAVENGHLTIRKPNPLSACGLTATFFLPQAAPLFIRLASTYTEYF